MKEKQKEPDETIKNLVAKWDSGKFTESDFYFMLGMIRGYAMQVDILK